jgi:hypothetical protein
MGIYEFGVRGGLIHISTFEYKRARGALEAWGERYVRTHIGIHQVHSMRASCSVLRDFIGRDGAIRFYFAEEARAELLLFKYCGQL